MSKARILAVDDQRYFRELIEGLLEAEGYDVQTASTGEEALHILEREDFEVVLTDLVMPGIDGAELVRRIKERSPEQDIVMVTGVVDVKTAVDSMKLGATDYVLKPFDRGALAESIGKILKGRRLRDEHARLMEENLEFMGVLSLFERASGLFSTLSVEPLAERLIEGLCLEARAQSGVLWIARDPGSETFELAGARGLVRVDGEPSEVVLSEIEAAWCPGLSSAASLVASLPEDAHGNEALYLPVRAEGMTLGLARLSDKIDAGPFGSEERAVAEKFTQLGGSALHNAMRFRQLERRSLRDPETRAYSLEYLQDAVRNEIQKAHRFGHRFSVARISLADALDPSQEVPSGADRGLAGLADRDAVELARRVEGALRATDLLAEGDPGNYFLLLPQTDALGAGVLLQRIRQGIAALFEGRESPRLRLSAATFPIDGSQVEALMRVLDERVAEADSSLLARRPEIARAVVLDPLFDDMLELGSIESADTEGQILRFVLEDVMRRPSDRGVLFISPGVRWLPDVLETLHDGPRNMGRTEIVLLAEGEQRDLQSRVTWVSKSPLDSRRPFLVYFGDGPAYAMIGQVTLSAARAALFQTDDRPLVEHLAFWLQRELGIVLPIEDRG